jgi:alpha-tubulin suppressor-like RCC1 family protein
MVKLEMEHQETLDYYPLQLIILYGKNILQISSGMLHTCVIANDSNSYCWGINGYFLLLFLTE